MSSKRRQRECFALKRPAAGPIYTGFFASSIVVCSSIMLIPDPLKPFFVATAYTKDRAHGYFTCLESKQSMHISRVKEDCYLALGCSWMLLDALGFCGCGKERSYFVKFCH